MTASRSCAVIFALCVAVSTALFGHDSSASIERTTPASASSFASAPDSFGIRRSDEVMTAPLISVRTGTLDATHVYDSTGRVLLYVLDRNGRVIRLGVAPDPLSPSRQ